MNKSFFLILSFVVFASFVPDKKPAYLLYTKDGKKSGFKDLLKSSQGADIILFGELHNNPISHWLQLELLKELAQSDKTLVLGAEMFERDDQVKIDEYFSGKFQTKQFEAEAKLWNNYKTDYKPLVEFARAENIKLVATNVPRRYANMVSKEGIESLKALSDEAKSWIAPLPVDIDYELPGYKQMMEMMEGHSSGNAEKFVQAQAIKDATMAYFINENYQKGQVFLHLNGAYHSNNYEGIFHYLKKYNPTLKVVTISTAEQDNIERLMDEHRGLADFILTIPKSMIKTF